MQKFLRYGLASFVVSLLGAACGPSTSAPDTADARPIHTGDVDADPYADGQIFPINFPDGGTGPQPGVCQNYAGQPITADMGPSYDDDGDCYCETAPCTGSSNPACTTLQGNDCNDCDPTVNPGAVEVNGDKVDNNCDGLADDSGSTTGSPCSATGTCPGAATCDSGSNLCTDGPDPSCTGIAANGACEGNCDVASLAGSTNAMDYAKSIGLCNGEVVSAEFVSPSDARAHAIMTSYGTDTTDHLNRPAAGATMVMLSTGIAGTGEHDPGTILGTTNKDMTSDSNNAPNPDLTVSQACGVDPDAIDFTTFEPVQCTTVSDCTDAGGDPGDTCAGGECRPAPPATVNDYTELKLQLKVPTNAKSFSYRFQYFSSEYPTYRCSQFNDTFLAELTSKAFNGGKQANISFDANDHVVSVDNGFFQVCDENDDNNQLDPDAPANNCLSTPNADTVMGGTGYDPMGAPDGDSEGAGATVELATSNVPVQPGETITLRYIIFDEGDGQLDSSVLLDNFQWSATPASPTGPVTTPPVIN